MTVGFTPFFSRLIEANLRELDQGRIEATRVIGVTTPQFIFRILLLPESLSGIIDSATIILVGLVEDNASRVRSARAASAISHSPTITSAGSRN